MISGSMEGTEYAFGVVSLPVKWSFPSSGATVQLVDPAFVFGPEHLVFSIYSHLKGFRLAREAGIDLLLRIMGTRKIGEAMAAKPGSAAVLVVVGVGAAQEYSRLVEALGASAAGDVASKPGELDAIERTALVSL